MQKSLREWFVRGTGFRHLRSPLISNPGLRHCFGMGLHRVCHQSELGSGNVRRLDDLDVAVFNVDGTFFAIKDVCTHAELPLSGGELAGETIVCPWHGACFSLRTGEALSLPATEPVETFPVILQGNDVFVEVAL